MFVLAGHRAEVRGRLPDDDPCGQRVPAARRQVALRPAGRGLGHARHTRPRGGPRLEEQQVWKRHLSFTSTLRS